MKKILYTLSIITLLFCASTVFAKEEMATSTSPIKESPLAVASEKVDVSDNVNGSSFIAGQDIKINSSISGITFVAGQTINQGGISDYSFVAGQDITISGNITKDTFIAGENVTIDNTAIIGRDLYIAASKVTILGDIERNIYVYSNEIVIDKNASIKGTINYNENSDFINKLDNLQTKTYKQIELNKEQKVGEILITLLYSIIRILLVFVISIKLMPKAFEKLDTLEKENSSYYFKSLGIGLLLVFSIPFAALILLITNFGLSLGLILLSLYFIGLYISKIIIGYILGKVLCKKIFKKETNNYLVGAIGIIIVCILSILPLIPFIIAILGLGIIYNIIKNK